MFISLQPKQATKTTVIGAENVFEAFYQQMRLLFVLVLISLKHRSAFTWLLIRCCYSSLTHQVLSLFIPVLMLFLCLLFLVSMSADQLDTVLIYTIFYFPVIAFYSSQ